MVLANRGATNSQVITPNVNSFGVSAASPVLTSIDTSVDQALTVTCTLATSTESCQMELISIDIYKP